MEKFEKLKNDYLDGEIAFITSAEIGWNKKDTIAKVKTLELMRKITSPQLFLCAVTYFIDTDLWYMDDNLEQIHNIVEWRTNNKTIKDWTERSKVS